VGLVEGAVVGLVEGAVVGLAEEVVVVLGQAMVEPVLSEHSQQLKVLLSIK
jgi:hypothetical protein